MNSKLITVALVSATAALGSPAFAQDASYGAPGYYGRSYAAPALHRPNSFRGAYNQAPAVGPVLTGPQFYDGWVTEGAIDRSRPGGLDPDFRPAE